MQNVLKWLLAVPLLAALLVPILGWQLETRRAQRNWSQKISRNRDKPIPVRTIAVEEKDGMDIVGATCVSQPSAAAELLTIAYSSELSVRVVDKVLVQEGVPVKKGDVLVEFQQDLHKDAAERADAVVEQLENQIENIEKILDEGAASKLELATAKAQLSAATFAQQLAEKDLELSTIRAPFDGVVGEMLATPGAHLTNSSPLCTVFQLHPLLVKVDFPIERLGVVKVGDAMEITFDSYPEEQHFGKVVSISPNARSQTRVLNVFVELPNSDLHLKGGITGYARLQRAKRSVTVPRTAVINRKGRSMVFKVVGDKARLTEVKTGPMLVDGELELIEGLYPGDEVVVFGHDELEDGAPVNKDWLRWANRLDKSDGEGTPRSPGGGSDSLKEYPDDNLDGDLTSDALDSEEALTNVPQEREGDNVNGQNDVVAEQALPEVDQSIGRDTPPSLPPLEEYESK